MRSVEEFWSSCQAWIKARDGKRDRLRSRLEERDGEELIFEPKIDKGSVQIFKDKY